MTERLFGCWDEKGVLIAECYAVSAPAAFWYWTNKYPTMTTKEEWWHLRGGAESHGRAE